MDSSLEQYRSTQHPFQNHHLKMLSTSPLLSKSSISGHSFFSCPSSSIPTLVTDSFMMLPFRATDVAICAHLVRLDKFAVRLFDGETVWRLARPERTPVACRQSSKLVASGRSSRASHFYCTVIAINTRAGLRGL